MNDFFIILIDFLNSILLDPDLKSAYIFGFLTATFVSFTFALSELFILPLGNFICKIFICCLYQLKNFIRYKVSKHIKKSL